MSDSPTRPWLMLGTVLSATFMSGFDANAVYVALPSLHREFHAGAAELELVVAGYLVSFAALLVTCGRLGDLLGHRRLFLAGLAGFALTSLLCGLARSPIELVVGRFLQGATAAAMVPQVIAMISTVFPEKDRPRAFSWLGVVIGIGGICGQVLGGLLVGADLFGWTWRPIFFVNVPIGVIALIMARQLIPRGEPTQRSALQLARFDPVGVIAVTGALALALIPLSVGQQEDWSAWTWACLAASVPVLALALVWERRQAMPLVDFRLFRRRSLNVGLLMYVAFMSFFVSMTFALSLLLQTGLRLSPLKAGLTFAPFAALAMVAALASPAVKARLGQRGLTLGAIISCLGMLGLGLEMQFLGGDINALWMQLPLCVVGIGNGLMLPLFLSVAMSGVRPQEAGSVSGLLTTVQQFSGALGLAGIGAVFFALLGTGTSAARYSAAAESVMWIGMALLAALALLTLLIPASPARSSAAPAASELEPETAS